MSRAALASAIRAVELRECRNFNCPPCSVKAMLMVLSQTVSVIVRLNVVAREPSKDVVASRFGRKTTPSGVVTLSGTETSTHATARLRRRPADEIDRLSSRIFATLLSNQSSYLSLIH